MQDLCEFVFILILIPELLFVETYVDRKLRGCAAAGLRIACLLDVVPAIMTVPVF